MSRFKKPLGVNVLTAARARIRHIYDIFDTVVVNFSGGKDSLVCLHLAREVCEERGTLPVNVIFRDEELIPDEVIDFVNSYRLQPWISMRWYAVPTTSSKFICGTSNSIILWDPDREHIRPVPPGPSRSSRTTLEFSRNPAWTVSPCAATEGKWPTSRASGRRKASRATAAW